METNGTSVFLMATNRLLRETLAKLLIRKGDFKVSGTSPHVPDAASLIEASGAEVLILDSASARLVSYTHLTLPTILRV